jgi:hypothetical protein
MESIQITQIVIILTQLLSSLVVAEELKPRDWSDPLDPTVITVKEIATGKQSVVLVIHEAGHGGWQFYDGSDVSDRRPRIMLKTEILTLDPSLKEITNLPVGWKATRKLSNKSWKREQWTSQ